MKREVIENLNEKDFIASLIMSDKCCQVLIPYIKINYLESDYSRVIISWLIDYFHKFKIAPKKDVVSLYRARCDEIQDEALKDLVYNYLKNISESDININNEDYLVDQARDYIEYRALSVHVEDLQACLETRSMDKARKIQANYNKVSVTEINEADILSKSSVDTIKNALAEEEDVLFTLPGELNSVVGNIHRNDFIAVLAAAKRGKSWMLQQMAIEAMKQRLNVVYVSMEMTREEVIRRLWKTLFGVKSGLVKPGLYESSKFVEDPSEQGKYKLELYDIKVGDKSAPSVEYLQNKLRTANNYTGNLKIIGYPAFSASVEQITNKVEDYAKKGFIADVLIIDYADITMPIGGGSELRNQLDTMWKHLRGFAMKFHCAVITASQTNRSGFSASVVGADSVAEDIRKLANVTSMVALEQTPKMKKNHILRVRNVALRNGEVKDTCVFPQCLALGQFIFGAPIPGEALVMEDDDSDN